MAREILKRLKMEYIFWWARRLPPCDQLLPLMSQRMDGKLAWRQTITLMLHNHICDWCRWYSNQLLLIRQAMRQQPSELENASTEDTLSPEMRERMKRTLNER